MYNSIENTLYVKGGEFFERNTETVFGMAQKFDAEKGYFIYCSDSAFYHSHNLGGNICVSHGLRRASGFLFRYAV